MCWVWGRWPVPEAKRGEVPPHRHRVGTAGGWGVYTTIGGRTAKAVLEEAAQGAAAIAAVGACAHWGSIQAARPNPTGAVGVSAVIKDKPIINVAGCPPIGDVVTATVAHFLTFARLPATASGKQNA